MSEGCNDRGVFMNRFSGLLVRLPITCALLFAAACGGGTTAQELIFAGPNSVSSDARAVTVTRNTSSGILTVAVDGFDPIELTTDDGFDFEILKGYVDADETFLTFLYEDEVARGALYASGTNATSMTGSAIARQSEVDLPSAGRATLFGEYVGLETYEGFDESLFATLGEAEIDANFVTGMIGGRITRRQSARTDGALPDVVFEMTPIASDATASGTTSGGLTSESVGTYEVLFAGSFDYDLLVAGTGTHKVIGQVRIDSPDVALDPTTVTDVTEYGVFVTEVGGFSY